MSKTKSSSEKSLARLETFRREMARFELLAAQTKELLVQNEKDATRRQAKLDKLIKSYDAALKALKRK